MYVIDDIDTLHAAFMRSYILLVKLFYTIYNIGLVTIWTA
jgi:hypothetical protein